MRELREEIFEEIIDNEKWNVNQFSSIADSILQIMVGFMNNTSQSIEADRYFPGYSDIESLGKRSSKLLGNLIKEMGLLNLELDYSHFTNREFRLLFDTIDIELDKHIKRCISKYAPEFFLINMLFYGSIMSRITITTFGEVEVELDFSDKISTLQHIFQLIQKNNLEDVRYPLGEIKKSIELAINFVLIENFSMLSDIKYTKMDYLEIITAFNAKNLLFQLKELIPLLKEKRGKVLLDEEMGIVMPDFFTNAFKMYAEKTIKEKIRVENDLTKELFKIFFDEMGFEPIDVINYITEDDNNRAFKIYNNYVSIAAKDLIRVDLMLNQKVSYRGSNNILHYFTLNTLMLEKYPSAIRTIESKNERLFRSPIIDLGDKLIVPTFAWLESIHYLSLRILNRDIDLTAKRTQKHWNELIKITYDEYDIKGLKEILKDQGFLVGKNWELGKVPEIKKIIESKKNIPHEIDLYYIDGDVLVIKDVKNYGMQHSISAAKKVVNKIDKDKEKMEGLRDFILKYIDIFRKKIGLPFDDVSVGILTVDPTIYNYLVEENESGKIQSIHEFKESIMN